MLCVTAARMRFSSPCVKRAPTKAVSSTSATQGTVISSCGPKSRTSSAGRQGGAGRWDTRAPALNRPGLLLALEIHHNRGRGAEDLGEVKRIVCVTVTYLQSQGPSWKRGRTRAERSSPAANRGNSSVASFSGWMRTLLRVNNSTWSGAIHFIWA